MVGGNAPSVDCTSHLCKVKGEVDEGDINAIQKHKVGLRKKEIMSVDALNYRRHSVAMVPIIS